MTTATTVQTVERGRKARRLRSVVVIGVLFALAAVLCCVLLVYGNTVYSLDTVIRVLAGERVQGASFAIVTLRLPRMLAAVLAGLAFAVAGNTFQTLLRNPLASPDIIGISSGSSAAAVFCILVLGIGGLTASLIAVAAGLITAAAIYLFSRIGGYSNGKLILIGIGAHAMLIALINYMILKAATYDVAAALRWLNGSLNGVQMEGVFILAAAVLVFCPVVFALGKRLVVLELGEQAATMLGVSSEKTRIALIVASVCLLAFATATVGPIAFIAFLSGPIAKRLIGQGQKAALAAGTVGVVLTLAADLIGQFAFEVSFPVGVITGVIGAPYLIFLLARMNKTGSFQ